MTCSSDQYPSTTAEWVRLAIRAGLVLPDLRAISEVACTSVSRVRDVMMFEGGGSTRERIYRALEARAKELGQ